MKTLGQLLIETATGPDKVRKLTAQEVHDAMLPIVERSNHAIDELRREQRRLLSESRHFIVDAALSPTVIEGAGEGDKS